MATANQLGTAKIDIKGENTKFRRVVRDNIKDINKLQKATKKQEKANKSHNKSSGQMLTAMKSVAAVAATGLSIGVVTQKITEMVQAASQAESKLAVIRNVLRQTGDEVGVTAGEIDRMVESISKFRQGSVNETRTAATKLLQIAENSKIAGDNIERTLQLAADMEASGWGDLEGNIEEIAEVFALPKEAIPVLEKYNVFFNDAAKRHIDYLVDTGRELEAMEQIYDRMEAKFSGAASAANQGLQGAMNRRNTELQLLNETLGGIIAEGFNLAGIFNSLADSAKDFRHWLDRTFQGNQGEFAGQSDAQIQFQRDKAARTRSVLQGISPDVDPASLVGFDAPIVMSDADIEKVRNLTGKTVSTFEEVDAMIGDLNERISNIDNIQAERALKDANKEWQDLMDEKDEYLKNLRNQAGIKDDETLTLSPEQQRVVDQKERAIIQARTHNFNVALEKLMTKFENDVERMNINMTRSYQLYADTRMKADQDAANQFANVYQEYGTSRTESDDQAWRDLQRTIEENTKAIKDEAEKKKQAALREGETIDQTLANLKKTLEIEKFFNPETLGGNPRKEFQAEGIKGLAGSISMDHFKQPDPRLLEILQVLKEIFELQESRKTAEWITDLTNGIREMGNSMFDFFQEGEFKWELFRNKGLDVAQSIADKFADRHIWEPFADMLSGLLDDIVDGIGSGISAGSGGVAGSKATGGRAQAGKAYKVHKDEMFIPDRSGYVYSKNDVKNMGGGGGDVVFAPVINSDNPDLVEAKMREMMPEFAQFASEQMTYQRTRPGKVRSQFGGNN